jgi:hypothetical protein
MSSAAQACRRLSVLNAFIFRSLPRIARPVIVPAPPLRPTHALTHLLSLPQQCNSVDVNTCTETSAAICGPSYCTDMNTAAKCDNSATTDINIATELAKVKTQTCTQATETKCTQAWLDANINLGRNGDGGVIAAYCTDRYLVLQTTMKPGWTTDMNDISQPPGGTASDNTACVTGEISSTMGKLETQVFPLEHVYELWATDDGTQNSAYFSGGAQATGQTDTGRYFSDGASFVVALPADAGVGISVAGQSIYPLYSNTRQITLESCEVDSCNEHVGQGGGQPHLHGDPFSATTGKCLYSPENYTNAAGTQDLTVHPPVIGFSYDGPLIYGRYLDNTAPGFSTGLDNCGGHVHDSYSYHYHSQVVQATTSSGNKGISKNTNTGKTYPAFVAGPYNCWKAKITDLGADGTKDAVTNFWAVKSDKDLTAVCSTSTAYWVKPGYTLPGAGATKASTAAAIAATGSGYNATSTTTTAADGTSAASSSAASVVASFAVAAAVAIAAM